MDNTGPVIIIEDDLEDQELFQEVFKNLQYKNELIFFADGATALDFLNTTNISPFLILSDINMPKLNGFELRNKIRTDAALDKKCIPYLFFSTAATQQSVIDAYSMSVQGFFIKQNSIGELQKTVQIIMEYWIRCASPNNLIGA
jgi:CheY-like chemotaxis protein